MSSNDADRSLVERAQAGDSRAFEMLVVKYQRRIERLIARMVRDADLVHDVAGGVIAAPPPATRMRACAAACAVLVAALLASAPPPSDAARPLPRVRVIATGGTIGNTLTGRLSASDLVAGLPHPERLARVETETFANLPSAVLTMDDCARLSRHLAAVLAADRELDGVVGLRGGRILGAMRVAFAADHAGAAFKDALLARLDAAGLGHELVDLGGDGSDPNDDYPDFAERLGRAIQIGRAHV